MSGIGGMIMVIFKNVVGKGIDESRVIVKSVYEGASNSKGVTKLDKAKNRRVEVDLVK